MAADKVHVLRLSETPVEELPAGASSSHHHKAGTGTD